jgi:integrase
LVTVSRVDAMPLKVTTRRDRGGLWIVGTVAGVRVRESAGTDNRSLAEEVKSRREQDLIRASLYGRENETTFAQAAVAYLEAGHSHRFLKPIVGRIGERRIASIKPGDIRDLADKLYPNAKPATKNRQVIAPTCAVINFAADRGWARPVKVKRFAESKPVRRSVDATWHEAFQAAASSHIAALDAFMFMTGARLGEALALRPIDVDLEKRTARARTTKNGDPHTYHLPYPIVTILAALKPRRGRVFGYTSKRHVYRRWIKACLDASIDYVPPHQAGRHSFATEMIVRHGRDIPTTAKAGNWKSFRMLERYAHGEGVGAAVDTVFGARPVSPILQKSPDVPGTYTTLSASKLTRKRKLKR